MKKSISFQTNETPNKLLFRELLKEKISQKEIRRNPVLGNIFENEKKIRFNCLRSERQYKSINIENIKESKKTKLYKKINSFQKIYYDINKEQKSFESEIIPLKKKNDIFMKHFNLIQEKKPKKFSKMLSEIKKRYFNKGYSHLPDLSNRYNIFKNNILLINQSDLERYIIYGLGNKKRIIKSLNFLNKIRENLRYKRNGNLRKLNNSSGNIIKEIGIRNNLDKDLIKKERENYKKEIDDYSNDLIKIDNTLKNLNNIDSFFQNDNYPLSTSVLSSSPISKKNNNYTRSNSLNDIFNDLSFINNKDDLKKKQEHLFNQKEEQKSNSLHHSIYKSYKNFMTKSLDQKIKINLQSPIENLYLKIGKINNAIKNAKKIEQFAFEHNIKYSKNVEPKSIFFQIEKNKNKILENSFVKKNLSLRKEGGKEVPLNIQQILNLSKEKIIKKEIKEYTEKSKSFLYDFDKKSFLNL